MSQRLARLTLAWCAAVSLLSQRSALSADPALARLEASPRHQEWVQVDSRDDRKVACFVVYPEIKEKALTVLVIHENKGLTDWVRGVADQLAEAGYIAVAPDLLSGKGPDGGNTDAFPSVDAATRVLYTLPPAQVAADLDAVFAYAEKIDAASGKVAVTGFCWGGGQTFAYAAQNERIVVAMPFYGPAPPADQLAKIKAPVFGFYGENDERITGQVPSVVASMKELGKTYEPQVYKGAGHGFMRAGEAEDASAADRKAREEGWARVKDILSKVK
jgi:carboxymethylenebutenolidase